LSNVLSYNPAKGGTKCEEKKPSITSTSTCLRQDFGEASEHELIQDQASSIQYFAEGERGAEGGLEITIKIKIKREEEGERSSLFARDR
jgi:hypothetical protein